MKYAGNHCWARLLLIVLIWLSGGLRAIQAEADTPPASDIWIVSSSENPFFRRSIRQIETRFDDWNGNITTLLSKHIEERRSQLAEASLIITLGARAMREIAALNLKRPLLHAYLTRYQYASNPPPGDSHSLLLDQPLQRYLDFNQMLTGAHTIGILNLAATAFGEQKLHELEQRGQLKIIQQILEPEHANPVAAVRQILKKADNLLALPAPGIYNRTTIKGILLAAYRLRKPVISYSPAHVRAGALGALYATPEQIGDQIAEIAQAWLLGEKPDEPFSLARYFAIDINQQVANALGYASTDKQALQQAIARAD